MQRELEEYFSYELMLKACKENLNSIERYFV